MNKSNSRALFKGSAEGRGDNIDWELRPGGMLVQRRDEGAAAAGPMIKVKVSHGSYQHEVSIPAQATFGDLKKLLAQDTGLEPPEQRLLFRGKEKENDECLHIAGVKDMAKIILLEDPASKERKLEEMKRNQNIEKACQKVAAVRAEVDKLSEQVSTVAAAVSGGTKVADQDFVMITEMLMIQLLKLDGIEAEGEAKVQRRIEVRRVQNHVETMDALKAQNVNPLCKNAVAVTTQWETFDSGVGSLNAPPPSATTRITHDWESFD
uniref:Ubiquitin-like domain-containing protein n=1 Tax=Araucaria cunninghamii TaxID=56994 RepID=A0A0D6R9Z7_ARACU